MFACFKFTFLYPLFSTYLFYFPVTLQSCVSFPRSHYLNRFALQKGIAAPCLRQEARFSHKRAIFATNARYK